jgi:hypothetical protein
VLNVIIAILIEKKVLKEDEGIALVDKLKYSTMPGDFPSADAMIKKAFGQIKRENSFLDTPDEPAAEEVVKPLLEKKK